MNASALGMARPRSRMAKAENMLAIVASGPPGQKLTEFLQLLRQRLLHIFALGGAVGGSELLTTYPLMTEADGESISMWITMMLLNRIFSICIAVAAITAVQTWISRRRTRLVAMATAVMAIGVGTSALLATEEWSQFMQYSRAWGGEGRAMFLYIFWLNTAFAGLLAILYEWQMRAELAMQAVRNTRMAGEAVERKTLESRLSGMKARVDPEFLFAVIARTEGFYHENIEAAEKLLEQLIEFLRASLPHTSEAKPTLDQEIKLCGAYLAIERSLRREELSYQVKADAGAAGSYFPPAVMLPLLQTLLTPGDQTVRPIHFSIMAEKHDCRIRTELTAHAALAPPPEEQLLPAVVALRAFFGENVTVVAKYAPFTGTTIGIEVPYVAA